MKIVVVGINHAGTHTVLAARKLYPNAEIIGIDRNTNISFLACGIALWVGGVVKKPDGLFYSNIEFLRSRNIDVRVEEEMIDVDFKNKKITIRKNSTKEEYVETYDKLVLGTGSWPIVPPFPGVDADGVQICKLFQHAQVIKKLALSKDIKNVVVVGAGYIGIELVEAFHIQGKKVTLIDMANRIMPRYFDEEFTAPIQNKMAKEGIKFALGEKLNRFVTNEAGHVVSVETDKGTYKCDIAIMAIGFRPNTAMFKGKLDLIVPSGAIKTNRYMETSQKDVFAIGDSVATFNNATQKLGSIALATNAVRTGVVAAMNLNGPKIAHPGVQGTNGIAVFGFNLASVGLSEVACKMEKDLVYKTVLHEDDARPTFMPENHKVMTKIIWEAKTGRIIGGQIGSTGHHEDAIIALSLAIQTKTTITDLALLDIFFLPHYDKPVHWLSETAIKGIGFSLEDLKK